MNKISKDFTSSAGDTKLTIEYYQGSGLLSFQISKTGKKPEHILYKREGMDIVFDSSNNDLDGVLEFINGVMVLEGK